MSHLELPFQLCIGAKQSLDATLGGLRVQLRLPLALPGEVSSGSLAGNLLLQPLHLHVSQIFGEMTAG